MSVKPKYNHERYQQHMSMSPKSITKEFDQTAFAERINELVNEFGSRNKLAQATSQVQTTINEWARGNREPSRKKINEFCEAINLNREWLLYGELPKYLHDTPPTPLENFKKAMEQFGVDWENQDMSVLEAASAYVRDVLQLDLSFVKPTDPERPPSSDFGYVPKSEARLSAGGGAFPVSEETEAYYAFRMEWLMAEATAISNLVLTEITGDSMSPRINHGDTILIDRGRTKLSKKPRVFAFRDNDTLHVKWLKREGKKITAISENAEYPPFEVDPEHMQIFGQVIGAWISFL